MVADALELFQDGGEHHDRALAVRAARRWGRALEIGEHRRQHIDQRGGRERGQSIEHRDAQRVQSLTGVRRQRVIAAPVGGWHQAGGERARVRGQLGRLEGAEDPCRERAVAHRVVPRIERENEGVGVLLERVRVEGADGAQQLGGNLLRAALPRQHVVVAVEVEDEPHKAQQRRHEVREQPGLHHGAGGARCDHSGALHIVVVPAAIFRGEHAGDDLNIPGRGRLDALEHGHCVSPAFVGLRVLLKPPYHRSRLVREFGRGELQPLLKLGSGWSVRHAKNEQTSRRPRKPHHKGGMSRGGGL
eukprot:5731674-Prymnesium_polylepis.1